MRAQDRSRQRQGLDRERRRGYISASKSPSFAKRFGLIAKLPKKWL
jgi:hypothetical protein